MSKLELENILGSSTSKTSLVGFAQDCLLYVAGSHIVFYNPAVDEQIAFLSHNSPDITGISVTKCEQFLAVSSIDRFSANNLANYSSVPNESEYSQSKAKKNQSSISIYKLGEVGVEDPVLMNTLKGHKYPIDHILYSPDGKYLVSISNQDGSMFVWNCTSGERLSQNKNSRNINCLKFMKSTGFQNVEGSEGGYDLVTSGRGFCKIWPFLECSENKKHNNKKFARVYEEEHWMLVGRVIPLPRNLAMKEFVDICFWRQYIILLTNDGELCLVTALVPQHEKFEKRIELGIQKATSIDMYRDKIICGGHNAAVKVVDLDSLSLICRLPKPPPLNKQNISTEYEEDEVIVCYDENEDFPQCTGVKVIAMGGNLMNPLIVTVYENLTMFVWRPEPTIAAIRSIITHRSSIRLVRILDSITNESTELTFFGTLSTDSTLRIWHIYKKWIENRESIDLAQLIGIKRNAYCRNLTRILYLEAEKQVTHIAIVGKAGEKAIACIAQREFLLYSLDTFQVIGHQVFDENAVFMEIKDETAYIGFLNGKIGIYQILKDKSNEIEDEGCTINKVREIEFSCKIKYMKIIEKSANETYIIILTSDTNEAIIYSLLKSSIIHVEKNVSNCFSDSHHLVMSKMNENKNTLFTFSMKKGKTTKLISLSHQMDEESEVITQIRCNNFWILILTSKNKIIVANFTPSIVCVKNDINEPINDLQLSQNREVIAVGDYGNICVFRLKGQNEGLEEMQGEVRKMMQKNDLSWLDNSVWAKKKSSMEIDRSINSNKMFVGSAESVKLVTSGYKLALSQAKQSNENNVLHGLEPNQQIPNVQIKYQNSERGDHSIFNPSSIKEQLKGVMANLPKNRMNVVHKKGTEDFGNASLEEINLSHVKKKGQREEQKQANYVSKNKSYDTGANSGKRRIFGSNVLKASKPQQNQSQCDKILFNKFQNNLVTSVVHHQEIKEKQKEEDHEDLEDHEELIGAENTLDKFKQNPGIFYETPQLGKNELALEKSGLENEIQFKNIIEFQILLDSQKFVFKHHKELERIHEKLGKALGKNNDEMVSKKDVEEEFEKLTKEFRKRLVNKSI